MRRKRKECFKHSNNNRWGIFSEKRKCKNQRYDNSFFKRVRREVVKIHSPNLIKEEVEKGNTPFKSVAILAFADWLKDICRRNHFYENKLEDRDVLIQIGDEMRCIDPDIFAKPVADAVKVFFAHEIWFSNHYWFKV